MSNPQQMEPLGGGLMARQNPLGLRDPRLFHEQGYINGRWCDARRGRRFDVDNPTDGSILGQAPDMGPEDIEAAIAAAAAALCDWRERTAAERGEILYRWYELLMENQEDLARIMTLEQGKPLKESRGEVAYAASFVQWFAEEGKRAYGDVIPPPKRGQHIVVIKQPVGVVAAITPWNFPAAMITRKAGAALAAGCTMIAKPAEETPFTAFALADLAERAGVPAGVFNVVTGDAPVIGRTLTDSPIVRKLSFTGSTEVGRKLMAQCAVNITKISLELGGNAPFIVFDDADLDAAVRGAIASKFRNTGQTCVCANRFLVQDTVHDAFVEKLKTAMEKLVVGDGLDENVDQTALINRQAVHKVREHLEDAIARGARVVFGGKPHPRGGNFVMPTLITGVRPEMRCAREETFGPLAAVMRFTHDEEAIRIANDTEYGLAAYFYCRDIHRVWRVAERLEAGIIGVNEGIISTPVAPFGGVKASGIGREGSRYGLEEFLEIKYLCMGGP